MSDLIWQVVSVLSVPPGNLVYHLVLIFVLYAIVLLAIGAGRRQGWSAATLRPAWAGSGALAGQFALMAAAWLALAGIASADRLLPPLEHFAGVLGVSLLLWAFTPLADEYPQASTVLLIVNLILAALVYSFFAVNWHAQPDAGQSLGFNGSLQDRVWTAWALVLLGLAGLTLFIYRRGDWGLTGAACVALLAGYGLHLGLGELSPHAPGWVRLGNLMGYPLLAGAMLGRITGGARQPAAHTVMPAGLEPMWQALEACRRVMDTPSLSAALQRAVSAIGATLDADVVAIGLLQADGRTIHLTALQHAGMPPRTGATFDADSQPTIRRAMAWQQPAIVVGGDDADQASLRALLGGGEGPLYIHPLARENVVSGMLIAGRRKASDQWNVTTQPLLSVLAAELAAAIIQRRAVERLSSNLARQEAKARQMREEADRLAAQLEAEQARREKEQSECAAQLRDAEIALEQTRRALAAAGAGVLPPAETIHKPAASHAVQTPPEEFVETDVFATPPVISAQARSDGSAYHNLFVEEAFKYLEGINEAIQRLQETRGQEALSQLLRSAHVLRGMAAAMNHTLVARLAGMLCDAVKRVRVGALSASDDMLNLFQDTSHILRVLVEDIRASSAPSMDIAPLLERWGPYVARASAPPPAEVRPMPVSSATTLHVRVELSPACQLKAVRAMVVLAQLRRIGKVLICQPDEPALRSGHIAGEFVVTLMTDAPASDVQALVASIADVARVDLQ